MLPTPILSRLLALILAAAASLPGAPVMAFETKAAAVYVLDQTTGTVLLEKNADTPLPPASMSKLMTLNMLFEALHDGRVTMDTTFQVSSRAKAMGGSTMFLNEQDLPTVEELIHGIIVNSGNDACVVVAEGLAGTEEAFSEQATARAQALGMTSTNLVNASGWPATGHRMSMQDLGILARRLIEEFPEFYPFFALTEYDYKNRAPGNRFNRNPLLTMGINADGLKTGHTTEAGYGLVGSAQQGDRRIIFVITGLATEEERATEAASIANWAFRQFAMKTVAKKDVRVAEADVWLGDATTVGLVVAEDTMMLVPALSVGDIEAQVVYTGPINAPIEAGAHLADLVVTLPELGERRIPLMAEAAVGKAGFVTRLMTAARVLIRDYAGGQASAATLTTEDAGR